MGRLAVRLAPCRDATVLATDHDARHAGTGDSGSGRDRRQLGAGDPSTGADTGALRRAGAHSDRDSHSDCDPDAARHAESPCDAEPPCHSDAARDSDAGSCDAARHRRASGCFRGRAAVRADPVSPRAGRGGPCGPSVRSGHWPRRRRAPSRCRERPRNGSSDRCNPETRPAATSLCRGPDGGADPEGGRRSRGLRHGRHRAAQGAGLPGPDRLRDVACLGCRRGDVGETSGSWRDGTTSWTSEASVTANRGDSLRNTLSWR
jgi:hypothetical protein